MEDAGGMSPPFLMNKDDTEMTLAVNATATSCLREGVISLYNHKYALKSTNEASGSGAIKQKNPWSWVTRCWLSSVRGKQTIVLMTPVMSR